jgi:hypothetical protein
MWSPALASLAMLFMAALAAAEDDMNLPVDSCYSGVDSINNINMHDIYC